MGHSTLFRNSFIKLPLAILLLLLISTLTVTAQVVDIEKLSKDHTGELKGGVNFPEGTLSHEWKFISQEGVKSVYQLELKLDEDRSATYDVRMRNLSIAFYIEVRMKDKEGETKTLSGIFDKGDKWLRVKMAPKQECKQEGTQWGRRNQIEGFNDLLDFVISELDRNVDLNCYL